MKGFCLYAVDLWSKLWFAFYLIRREFCSREQYINGWYKLGTIREEWVLCYGLKHKFSVPEISKLGFDDQFPV